MSQNTEDFTYVLPKDATDGQKPGRVAARSLGHWLAKGFQETDRHGEPVESAPVDAPDYGDTPVPDGVTVAETPTDPGTSVVDAPDSGTAAELDADNTVPASDTPKNTGRAGRGR